jgi:hypothetical protein
MTDMSKWKNVLFSVTYGTDWDLTLPGPVGAGRPIVSFHDFLGSTCGVDTFVSTTDSRIVTVRSRSGLPMSGTISVKYCPAVGVVRASNPRAEAVAPEARSA